MKKIMTKFLMWFLIGVIALPAMILTMPVKAQAATKNAVVGAAPVTKLITSPKNPEENGWFNQVTLIKLKSNEEGETYFQWNTTSGEWIKFDQAMRAWRGVNTLYYYSVTSAGVKEAIKSQVIKMDYGHPASPDVQVTSAEAQVRISWEERSDIASFRIAKDGEDLSRVPSEPPFFIDQNVKVNDTHLYKMKAVNQAGLKSKAVKHFVIVSAILKSQEIQPAIGEGATIERTEKVASIQTEKVEPTQTNPPTTPPETEIPVKNWNRLFVALSILIIAAGAAVAGYYGYEWWIARRETEEPRDKKSSSRW